MGLNLKPHVHIHQSRMMLRNIRIDIYWKSHKVLFEMNVPKWFWSDGVLTSAYLIHRMLSKTLGRKSPIETLSPNTTSLQVPPKIFGCTNFVHIPKHKRDKLGPKAIKCIFVGYHSSQKGYKCYAPGPKGCLFVIMDVSFHEEISFY